MAASTLTRPRRSPPPLPVATDVPAFDLDDDDLQDLEDEPEDDDIGARLDALAAESEDDLGDLESSDDVVVVLDDSPRSSAPPAPPLAPRPAKAAAVQTLRPIVPAPRPERLGEPARRGPELERERERLARDRAALDEQAATLARARIEQAAIVEAEVARRLAEAGAEVERARGLLAAEREAHDAALAADRERLTADRAALAHEVERAVGERLAPRRAELEERVGKEIGRLQAEIVGLERGKAEHDAQAEAYREKARALEGDRARFDAVVNARAAEKAQKLLAKERQDLAARGATLAERERRVGETESRLAAERKRLEQAQQVLAIAEQRRPAVTRRRVLRRELG